MREEPWNTLFMVQNEEEVKQSINLEYWYSTFLNDEDPAYKPWQVLEDLIDDLSSLYDQEDFHPTSINSNGLLYEVDMYHKELKPSFYREHGHLSMMFFDRRMPRAHGIDEKTREALENHDSGDKQALDDRLQELEQELTKSSLKKFIKAQIEHNEAKISEDSKGETQNNVQKLSSSQHGFWRQGGALASPLNHEPPAEEQEDKQITKPH